VTRSAIVLGTFACQVLLVQFAGVAFTVVPLTLSQWVFCVGLGASAIPFQFVINIALLLFEGARQSQTHGVVELKIEV